MKKIKMFFKFFFPQPHSCEKHMLIFHLCFFTELAKETGKV